MAEPIPEHNSDSPSGQDEITALDAFGISLAQKRKEAIDGRQQLGIEEEWLEDEEAYIGVDDANRAEYRSTWRQTKPSASGQFGAIEKRPSVPVKSTALINITRPYVDQAAARVADMLLPNEDRCWAIEPTPIPDLPDHELSAIALEIPLPDGTLMPITREQFIEEMREIAKERADRAQERIDDWLSECRWGSQMRAAINSASKIGTGVLKGPFPKSQNKRRWNIDPATGMVSMQVETEIVPQSVFVDPWNVFPDPGCGEDIQDGEYFWERDYITVKRLLGLRFAEGYIKEQIEACIREGPIGAEVAWTPSMEIQRTSAAGNSTPFEIWYFHGVVQAADLQAAGVDVSGMDIDHEGRPVGYVEAMVTMVNHRVIRATISPLQDGTFPYDFLVWQHRPGMPWGIGVARQMRTPQRMLTAGVRNMMDNAALSAGPQIIVDSRAIVPLDGRYEIVPRKVWIRASGNTDDVDVDKAFRVAHIETRQAELMNIIMFALRMAEEATGMPMILQGQMGEKAPETLGGMQMLQNNASAVMRRLAREADEMLTIPHITRYYHWLMEHGTDPEEKGDHKVVARGSSTLVERDLQNQELQLVLQMAGNPIFELSPAKTAEEYLRSRRFDPERFKPEEGEQAVVPGAADAAAAAEAENARTQAQLEDKREERASKERQNLLKLNSENERFNAELAIKAKQGSGI